METWNRDELYAEIWEQPMVKIAPKYGISAVALGKVCRKLQIPLPGRGYWVKKDFGKPVKRVPLPVVKNLPVVHRIKFPPRKACQIPKLFYLSQNRRIQNMCESWKIESRCLQLRSPI
jgi:hypothetical protein